MSSKKETVLIKKIDNTLLSIKSSILGERYMLTYSFIDSDEIKKINKHYRNKNVSTDILSFPLSPNEGEIYISINEAKKEAPKFDRDLENFIKFLFIHGCVHLKGYDHSDKMESIEAKFRKKFGV
jgi:probable rRNA maturation factor